MGQERAQAERVYTEISRAPGFPVQVVDLGEGQRAVLEELKSLSRGGVPVGKFKAPTGFTRVSSDEMGMGLGERPQRGADPEAPPDPGDEKE
jgi:hypothetical protein